MFYQLHDGDLSLHLWETQEVSVFYKHAPQVLAVVAVTLQGFPHVGIIFLENLKPGQSLILGRHWEMEVITKKKDKVFSADERPRIPGC